MNGKEDQHAITVVASPEEIRSILRDMFTEEELAGITITEAVDPDDELLGPRRGLDPVSVIEWAGLAIAGNALYDLSKAATVLLVAKLGAARIIKDAKP